MILDLHTHSIASDDGRAKVENYCQWIARKELPLDGFVLTEHRQFDDASDYRSLEDEFGLLILKASEVETEYGHVLVFGVNDDLRAAFDFARINNPNSAMVLKEADRCGAVAIPCHPGRPKVGALCPLGDPGSCRRRAYGRDVDTAAVAKARTNKHPSTPRNLVGTASADRIRIS